MIETTVVTRYARALFTYAADEGMFDQVEEELEAVDRILAENRQLMPILCNPRIAQAKKLELIETVFAPLVSPLVKDFLGLVVKRRREEILESILEVYTRVADQARGVMRARVQSTIPLPEAKVDLLRRNLEALTGKTVKIETEVAPEILGGVLVRFNNTVMDGSLKQRLSNLKEALLKAKIA
ncbi:MAG: ATP synthase F1 subunit delta [bacterium]